MTETTMTVKYNQLNPPRILIRVNENTWHVEGRSKPFYVVTRSKVNRRAFYCNCPASGICRHIQKVIRSLYEETGFDLVQFWQTAPECKRQKRRANAWLAKGVEWFFVNYASRPRRKLTSQIQDLDNQIESLGQQVVIARRWWYAVGGGQQKADAAKALSELGERIAELTREREALATRSMMQ